jgi:energy-coupling factor transport system ATP-binding protein
VLAAVRAGGSGVVVATHDDALVTRADTVTRVASPRPERDAGMPAEPARRSLATRCGPLSLLLAGLLVLPLPALVEYWAQSLLVLAVELVLVVVALAAPGTGAPPPRRWRRTLVRMLPALVGVLGVGWSTWLLGGHQLDIAVGASLRVLTLVLPSVALLPFVDADQLGDHLSQRLRLPARPVVAATAALQRFQSFGDLWGELSRARRVRGIGAGRSIVARTREVAATTLALFVAVLGQAAVLALAMDARGFAGASRRTWAGPAPWRYPDALAVLGGILVVATGAVARAVLPG